jgi:hypothetical protein
MCKWFNVKDELPKDNEEVLAACITGWGSYYLSLLKYKKEKNKWFNLTNRLESEFFGKVTHWLLPEIPKD